MKTAHLFAGIGGGLLADLILGHTPILAVENNEYCCKVLEEKKYEGWFPDLHIHYGDVREFDFTLWRGRVDCISAGFPCQDISCVGRGVGITGERSGLVWEVFRAIDEIQPKFVFLENSPGIRTKGRKEVTSALVERGYRWRDGKISANDVGSPHLRERWFCLAANADGMRELEQKRLEQKQRGRDMYCASSASDFDGLIFNRRCCSIGRTERIETSADTLCNRLEIAVQQGGISQSDAEAIQAVARYTGKHHWSQINIDFLGVVHGDSNRSHRIKALGNAQVPLQAAAAFMILIGG